MFCLFGFDVTECCLGFDKGAADLMASGKIKVKQGVEPVAYSSAGLVFSDGSELAADVIIFA